MKPEADSGRRVRVAVAMALVVLAAWVSLFAVAVATGDSANGRGADARAVDGSEAPLGRPGAVLLPPAPAR
jgi:hypothetical protein